MLKKPLLNRAFRLEILPPDTVFILSEQRQHVFQGEAFVRLLPLLDGSRDISALVRDMRGVADFTQVLGMIMRLGRQRVLLEGENVRPREDAWFWDSLGVPPPQVDAALEKNGVAIAALPPIKIDQDAVAGALVGAGLRVDPRGPITLLLVDDHLRPELEQWNRRALDGTGSLVLARVDGMVPILGPWIRPGGACWKCLHQRLEANRQVEKFIRQRQTPDSWSRPGRSATRPGQGLALSWLALELARLVVEAGQAPLAEHLLTFDSISLTVERHRLVKRPQCSACQSKPWRLRPKPIELASSPVSSNPEADGRTTEPRETLALLEHHISPLTGLITSLVSRQKNPYGRVHNYVAGHAFPVLTDDLNLLRVNAIARSGGKGETDLQAKTSAVCEAIERYSGIFWGEEEIVHAPFSSLGQEKAWPARALTLFSDAQYAHRHVWNDGKAGEFHFIPNPLDDETPIAWTTAWSLTRRQPVHLPMAYCFYGYRDPGHFFCKSDSNGNAAGNTREEAIFQGLMELVERDAVAIWWYNRLRRPAVDADALGLPYWQEMQQEYAQLHCRDLEILDLTNDLNIPVFVAVSRRIDRPVEDIILGFGAHPDPRLALMRALSEANQYLPALGQENEKGETVYQLNHPEAIQWWKEATVASQPWVTPDPDRPARLPTDFPSVRAQDHAAIIRHYVDHFRRLDLEILVLDQARPDIGLPVVKVVVPGLRHFWRRLAPGRLYDVPVTMGWRETRSSEQELNPISCFI